MKKWQVIQDDVIKWAESYEGLPFHSLLTDPPYHLTGSNGRGGFMGQAWDGLGEDGRGVAFIPETWAALAQHLYPGAFGMAFASSRGFHRLAVAIEDAGLRIHPMIGWLTSQSFPKATRIDTQIDRNVGAVREIIGMNDHGAGNSGKEFFIGGPKFIGEKHYPHTSPATPLAQAWVGHRYGGQAIKNSLEPIIVFQKPYEGRPVDNITETGAGAINVDGGRMPVDPDIDDPRLGGKGDWNTQGMARNVYGDYSGTRNGSSELGRWPSNFILDESLAPVLDAQIGHLKSGTGSIQRESAKGEKKQSDIYGKESRPEGTPNVSYGDEGGASRFFHQVNWDYEILENEDLPVRYCAKPSRAERDAGLDELPMKTMNRINAGGLENEKRWAPVEARNIHPCVKPIKLCKYLATLLLPPDTYAPRRILIPFAGSGAEMKGAILTGWEAVTGIEQSEEYCEIARAGLEWWAGWQRDGQTDIDIILAAAGAERKQCEAGQGRLF